MTTHITEDNINFYEELFKSLDDSDDDDDDTTLCQITGMPLIDNSITLECNHHFNYDALYKEIYRQKFVFYTYTPNTLSKNEYKLFQNSKVDFFIKCPYCRNIQFTILPYYEELGLEKIYGINTLDKSFDKDLYSSKKTASNYYSDDYTFYQYGVTFKKGICCYPVKYINSQGIQSNSCYNKHVASIPETTLLYCTSHYRQGLKMYKLGVKQAAMEDIQKKKDELKKQKDELKKQKEELKKQKDENKKQKEELKKQKEELKKQKDDLLEQKNSERVANGLPPLKRLPVIKNEVKEQQTIVQYIPEEDEQIKTACISILKSGPNKGKQCCCKIINDEGFCKRHETKEL